MESWLEKRASGVSAAFFCYRKGLLPLGCMCLLTSYSFSVTAYCPDYEATLKQHEEENVKTLHFLSLSYFKILFFILSYSPSHDLPRYPVLTVVCMEGGRELPMFPQHCGTADESVCGVSYEGEEVRCSTEMERKSSPCWKQSEMREHESSWLKTYLCYLLSWFRLGQS